MDVAEKKGTARRGRYTVSLMCFINEKMKDELEQAAADDGADSLSSWLRQQLKSILAKRNGES